MKTPSWIPPALLLAAVTFGSYSPALRGDFLWDEDVQVAENPVMTEPGGLRRIWTVGQTEQYYPATYTAFWLERRLWGLDTLGYHLVNVSFHVLNALLAGFVLSGLGLPRAWLAAAIFALHPVHVESVAWIMERKNVMSGTFYLLALACWLRYEDGRGRRWYAGALASFILALLSKTVSCTFPVAVLLLRWGRGLRTGRAELRSLAPFFILAAVMSQVTVWAEILRVGTNGPDFELTWLQRGLLSCRALWFYAGKLAWPAGLCFNYERWVLDPGAPAQWAGLAGVCGVAAGLWAARGRLGRGVLAGTGFFVLTLLPALGFFKVYPQRYSYVADHFQYLASLGLIAVAAAVLDRAGGRRRWLSAMLLCVLAALTWRQSHIYQSRESLWRDTLSKNPRSFLAWSNAGLVLHEKGLIDEAVRHYREALRLKPDLIEAHNNLGNALAKQGRFAEAVRHFRLALTIQPAYSHARNNLGLALASLGRWDEAIACYERALALNPGLTGAHYNLGLAFAAQGRLDAAAREFRAVVRERPDYANARRQLEKVLGRMARRGAAP